MWNTTSVNYGERSPPNYLQTLDERYEQIKGSANLKVYFDQGRITYDDRLKMFHLNHFIENWREWSILTYNQMRLMATVLTGAVSSNGSIPSSQNGDPNVPSQQDIIQNQQIQSMKDMMQSMQTEIQRLHQRIADSRPSYPGFFPKTGSSDTGA